MINKTFIKKLKKDFDERESERRQIISLSNIVLHSSKRAIFSLHRSDFEKAQETIQEVEKILKKLEKKFGSRRLNEEGSYKAGAEEYVEAKMFYLVLTGKSINKIQGIRINFDSYLGGICDLTGELVRRAINEAARENFQEVKNIKKTIHNIMAELVEFDMTGYLRTKYDQAKNSLRKIDQIDYEIRIRKL